MDIKFGKDTEEHQQQPAAENKGKQSVMLVVLLLLVCGFGYVYFFTDVIKPQQEQKAAEAPAPQVVKKPLPPSDGQAAKTEPPAAPAATPAAAPAPAPVAAAAKPEPSKPAVEAKKADVAKPAVEPKKVDTAKPAAKSAVPAVAKVDEKKTAPVEKKPAATPEKKVQPVTAAVAKPVVAKKPVEKKASAEPAPKKETPKPEQKAVASTKENGGTSAGWTVLVGSYVLEEALVTDLVRVRKAGLDANIVAGGQKKTKMNRLLLAEFEDHDTAKAQLEKLKRFTSDAFIIDSAGKHIVYAGSYLLDARAGSEKERLAAAGFNLTVKRVDVSIGTKNLTAGVFTDKKAAEEALKTLKAAGFSASVIRR